jgi:hypothetical protein
MLQQRSEKAQKKGWDENTSALGCRTGIAAKERKDRKKERDKKPLKWAKIQMRSFDR